MFTKSTFGTVLALLLSFAFVGCPDDSVGSKLDEAVEEVQDEARDAAEEVKDEIDDATK